MNITALGPSPDAFSPRSQTQFLYSHHSYTKHALPKTFEIQESIDRQIDLLSIDEAKTPRKPATTLKDSLNSEINSKCNIQKIVFKDAAKGILIRKNDKSHSRVASIERSFETKSKNAGSIPPSEENRGKESSKEILKASKRISLIMSLQKEVDPMKSAGGLTSLLNFKNIKKVTFAAEVDGQERYTEDFKPKSCRNSSSRRNLKSISEYGSSSAELNHKAEKEISRRGPRLICEALLSGINPDLLFKEAKSPRDDPVVLRTGSSYIGLVIGQSEDGIQEGSIFKLPFLASAREKKTVMIQNTPYQINSERSSVEYPLKKIAADTGIKHNVNASNTIENVFKNPLRKTVSFTVGRNGGKGVGLSTESGDKLVKHQSDQLAEKRVLVEELVSDMRSENLKKPAFSLFKRQQSFTK